MNDLPVLISTHEPFVLFSLPCPVEEGSDRAALVGTWHPARVNPPQRVIKHWNRFSREVVESPPLERGAHAGAGLLAGLVTLWGTHAGAVHEELQPVGRTHIGEVREGLSPVGGTPCWSRGRV